MVASTFRPSGANPLRVSGSYVQCTSITSPVRSSLITLHTLYKVTVAQTNLPAGGQPVKLLGRILQKVFSFDVELAREGDFPGTHGGILGMIGTVKLLNLAFRVIVNYNAQWSENSHDARGPFIQILPHTVLKEGHINDAVILGNADALTEAAYGFGGVTSSAACPI